MVQEQASPKEQMEIPQIVAAVEDLFFGTKIADAAKRAGAAIVFTTTTEALWQRIAQMPTLIVFDLTYSKLDPLEQLRKLRADSRYASIATLGYLPHVREDLREEAIRAGCQRVMPRSAFSSRMNEVIHEALNKG